MKLESPKTSRVNKKGFTTTNKPPRTNPGQQLRPVFILGQNKYQQPIQEASVQWTIWERFTPYFSSPPWQRTVQGCYTLYTLTNASYSWRLRSNANLTALQDGFQAKDGRNSIQWSRHAWRFHALLCGCINQTTLNRCMRGGAKQPNSALNGQYTWK
jgi:hypothetical protein